jgi:CMP-N-acetylneuraminic acid synthetase
MLAIIPVKSKSTRLPNKNVLDVGGKPLFEWTFDTCRNTKSITEVVVATDIDVVKTECEKNHFEFYSLSKDDIEDRRTVRQLWRAISKTHKGDHILLQVTNPFRLVGELEKAIQVYQSGKHDMVFSVRVEPNPQVNKHGKPAKNLIQRRSQEAEPHYYLSGTFWISNADYVSKHTDFEEGKVNMFPVHPMSCLEIDTKEDLEFARIIAKGYEEANDSRT